MRIAALFAILISASALVGCGGTTGAFPTMNGIKKIKSDEALSRKQQQKAILELEAARKAQVTKITHPDAE